MRVNNLYTRQMRPEIGKEGEGEEVEGKEGEEEVEEEEEEG